MKNVSFMQLILGVSGALLMYAGIKDLDLKWYITHLVTDPYAVFSGTTVYAKGGGPKVPDVQPDGGIPGAPKEDNGLGSAPGGNAPSPGGALPSPFAPGLTQPQNWRNV
jgi:hypothetical protein